MCVRDVKVIRDRPGDEMYCILWAVLTYFNIDDPSSAIISHMWSVEYSWPCSMSSHLSDLSYLMKRMW